MEYTMVDTIGLETSIEIVDEATVEEEIFVETIEFSQHDVDDTTSEMVSEPYEEDPLELPEKNIPIRQCYIQVERCDKIWETMKLIRELQEPTADSTHEDSSSGNEESVEPSSPQQNSMGPYIKYQPVLSNGNKSLPNFEFSVKSTRALYQCNTCGRQYSQRQTLRDHSEKAHNIIIPSMRRPAKTKVETTSPKTNLAEDQDEESNQGSAGSISSSTPSIDKEERLLDSASDSHESELIPARGKGKHGAPCHYCSRVLSDRYYLKVHETLIHGVKTHFPNGSGPRFLQKRLKKTTHTCNKCGRYFLSQDNYNRHMRNSHGLDKQSQSSSSVSSTSTVRSRQRSSMATEASVLAKTRTLSLPSKKSKYLSTIRPCDICGKVWSSTTNWKIHMNKAHGICVKDTDIIDKKPSSAPTNSLGIHTCEYCGKKFNWKTTLYNHVVLSHLKEQIAHKAGMKNPRSVKQKPPEEKMTSSSSSANSNLIKCTKCPRFYLSRRSLKIHQAKVHGMIQPHVRKIRANESQKAFKCDICPVRFQSEKSKAQHQMIYHGIRSKNQQQPRTRKSGIQASIPAAPVRILREKGRLNYSEESIAAAASAPPKPRVHKSPHPVTPKPKPPPPSSDSADDNSEQMFQCILCSKHRKHIRKHFIEFHKVRHPDILISQCQPSPLSTEESQLIVVPEVKKETKNYNQNNKRKQQKPIIKQEEIDIIVPQKKKRRPIDSMRTVKRMRVPGPQEAFELRAKEVKGGRRRFYCCKVCEFMSLNYDTTRKHVRLEHTQEQVEEALKSAATLPVVERQRRSDTSLLTRNRRRDSATSEEAQKRRLSAVLGDELRLTRAVKRLREELEHKCENCERVFRNGDILTAHKSSCRVRGPIAAPCTDMAIDSNDTRESSDRDSGIGISITIKKKNDSYEIVSRDSSGERPRAGDQYSDASSDTRNSTTFGNDHHQITQLEESTKSQEGEHEAEVVVEDDHDDNGDIESEQSEKVEPGQVPSLKELCNRVLGRTQKISKFKAKRKKMFWSSSKKARNNRKTRTEVYRVDTLKNLCVNVLVANGDVEAASKIWYPCHVCKSTWSTHKSRVIHANSHSRK